MSETHSEFESDAEEESLAKDLKSLRELLESEATASQAAQFKPGTHSFFVIRGKFKPREKFRVVSVVYNRQKM